MAIKGQKIDNLLTKGTSLKSLVQQGQIVQEMYNGISRNWIKATLKIFKLNPEKQEIYSKRNLPSKKDQL